jgi:putative intracellular protease/amidase
MPGQAMASSVVGPSQDAYAAGKVIGSVCHGPAGLVNAKVTDPADPYVGRSILYGKQVRVGRFAPELD